MIKRNEFEEINQHLFDRLVDVLKKALSREFCLGYSVKLLNSL